MTSESNYRIHSSAGTSEIAHLASLHDNDKKRRSGQPEDRKRRAAPKGEAEKPEDESEEQGGPADDGEHMVDYFA